MFVLYLTIAIAVSIIYGICREYYKEYPKGESLLFMSKEEIEEGWNKL